MVQNTPVQSVTLVLQALRLGQHSPLGIGAGVPSGQILRSRVQATRRHRFLVGMKAL